MLKSKKTALFLTTMAMILSFICFAVSLIPSGASVAKAATAEEIRNSASELIVKSRGGIYEKNKTHQSSCTYVVSLYDGNVCGCV